MQESRSIREMNATAGNKFKNKQTNFWQLYGLSGDLDNQWYAM